MGLPNNLRNFLYNLDRAIASLFGAPPQETISSEWGRHDDGDYDSLADIGATVLNKIQSGHTEHAVKHADALDKVDDGEEK